MVFTSPIFIFIFLPLLFLFYFSFQKWLRNYILLFFSISFFAWAEPRFIFVVLISALIDWICGKLIYHYRHDNPAGSKLFVTIAIVQNAGILLFYKYTNFLVDNINSLFSLYHLNPIVITKIMLPIGVSFIVFEKITYSVDIYRHEGEPSRSFRDYLLYVFLFPKLLAGPIIKYHDIADQLKTHRHDSDSIIAGITRFCFGFAKKVFIADSLGEISDQVFGLSAGQLGCHNAWLGILCYTSIYCKKFYRFLEKVAHISVQLDKKLFVYSAGRQPCINSKNVFQPVVLFFPFRGMAWGKLDLHLMGGIPGSFPCN